MTGIIKEMEQINERNLVQKQVENSRIDRSKEKLMELSSIPKASFRSYIAFSLSRWNPETGNFDMGDKLLCILDTNKARRYATMRQQLKAYIEYLILNYLILALMRPFWVIMGG